MNCRFYRWKRRWCETAVCFWWFGQKVGWHLRPSGRRVWFTARHRMGGCRGIYFELKYYSLLFYTKSRFWVLLKFVGTISIFNFHTRTYVVFMFVLILPFIYMIYRTTLTSKQKSVLIIAITELYLKFQVYIVYNNELLIIVLSSVV